MEFTKLDVNKLISLWIYRLRDQLFGAVKDDRILFQRARRGFLWFPGLEIPRLDQILERATRPGLKAKAFI